MFTPDMDKNSLEWQFGAATRMQHNYLHSFMRAQGITEVTHPRLLFILEALEGQGQDFAQCELAHKLGVSPASVAVSLKRMEKSGLVERQAATDDNRRNIIRFTEKGRQVVKRCHEAMGESLGGLFTGFSAEERAELSDYLTRIIANLQAMGATLPGFLED